ncbi:MAG: Ig-like domain-containing protein [Tannerella sp.]|jgi:hypothetical protein|nr:Ig-like domain-containing protein [Tannerella sp.]
MKLNTVLIGYVVACLCVSGCGKDKEDVALTDISVTPETLNSLEIGETARLTAILVPADATDKDIRWTSDNTSVATVSGNETAATVTAVAGGTAVVHAADKTGKIVSNRITVTVYPSDRAKVTGNYAGTAQLSGEATGNISNVNVSLAYLEDSETKAKFTISALDTEIGPMNIETEVNIQESSAPHCYLLDGEALLSGIEYTFKISGEINTTDETLSLVVISPDADITLFYTGVKK